MTLLLIIAVVCLAFGVAFGLTDQPAPEDDEFTQPTHVRLLDDQEPAA